MTVYYYYPWLWELFKYILVILLYVLAGLGYVLMCQVKYEKNVALNALVQMSEDSTRNKIRRIEGLIGGLTVS